ncbi:hypothetical protein LZ31DRAFT_98150 [Colletotrichum somersetense]|nr:hypothetical protein LZ31DRAFT_98150 [Colletotrichum somersetense]
MPRPSHSTVPSLSSVDNHVRPLPLARIMAAKSSLPASFSARSASSSCRALMLKYRAPLYFSPSRLATSLASLRETRRRLSGYRSRKTRILSQTLCLLESLEELSSSALTKDSTGMSTRGQLFASDVLASNLGRGAADGVLAVEQLRTVSDQSLSQEIVIGHYGSVEGRVACTIEHLKFGAMGKLEKQVQYVNNLLIAVILLFRTIVHRLPAQVADGGKPRMQRRRSALVDVVALLEQVSDDAGVNELQDGTETAGPRHSQHGGVYYILPRIVTCHLVCPGLDECLCELESTKVKGQP